MKKTATLICTLITVLSFAIKAESQSLLSPDELISIRKMSDTSTIDKQFSAKGYAIGYLGWRIENTEKVCDWIFQSHPGEYVDFSLTRTTDAAGKTKVVYCIDNLFYYKVFIQSLTQAKYAFAGVDIIDKKATSIFQKGEDRFFVQQRVNPDKSIYFVVQIE